MWLRVHEHMYNLDNIRSMRFKYKNHSADPEESNVNSVFIEFNNGQSTTRYFKHMHELFKVEQKFLIACGEYSTDSDVKTLNSIGDMFDETYQLEQEAEYKSGCGGQ